LEGIEQSEHEGTWLETRAQKTIPLQTLRYWCCMNTVQTPASNSSLFFAWFQSRKQIVSELRSKKKNKNKKKQKTKTPRIGVKWNETNLQALEE
jgi:hypothetical protein